MEERQFVPVGYAVGGQFIPVYIHTSDVADKDGTLAQHLAALTQNAGAAADAARDARDVADEATTRIGSMETDVIPGLQQSVSDLTGFVGYTDSDIFGLEADFQNSRFTRLAGAVGRNGGADFDNINAFGGRRRCIVADDGAILAYHGDSAYTETGSLLTAVTVGAKTYDIGEAVQVMVYQPKFYYKVVPLLLEKIPDSIGYHMRKARYYVSDTAKNGFKVHPAFIKNGTERQYVLIGAFQGCAYDVSAAGYNITDEQNADFTATTGDKLSSIANAKPISGLTQDLTRRKCGILAENRGAGWSQTYAAIVACTQLLMIIEYATFNTQTAIGWGVTGKAGGIGNESELTGQTSQLGNATGMATGTNWLVSVSYRGEENPWGNIWMFVDGINVWGDGTLRGGVPFIADNAFAESKRTDNYRSAGFTFANASNYVSAMGYGEPDFDWLFMASETAGNSNTPVGDNNYVTANLNDWRIARLGGNWASSSGAGGFGWYVSSVVSLRFRDTGGRLVYVPAAILT